MGHWDPDLRKVQIVWNIGVPSVKIHPSIGPYVRIYLMTARQKFKSQQSH